MTDPTPNPFRYGPTRRELKFWLIVSTLGLALMTFALIYHGFPGGAALLEVVGLPTLLFGYLGLRSIKRLIRREHP